MRRAPPPARACPPPLPHRATRRRWPPPDGAGLDDRLQAVAADPADAEEADARPRERGRACGAGERRRHGRVTSALRKPSGRSRVASSASPSRSQRIGMRVEGARVEPAGGDRLDRRAHALDIDLRVALVGVDDVEAAPVPQPHVDLARAVLVVAGDDQPAALAPSARRRGRAATACRPPRSRARRGRRRSAP